MSTFEAWHRQSSMWSVSPGVLPGWPVQQRVPTLTSPIRADRVGRLEVFVVLNLEGQRQQEAGIELVQPVRLFIVEVTVGVVLPLQAWIVYLEVFRPVIH